MKSITVHGKSSNEIIDIVRQMKEHGWINGVDFDWEYHKAESFAEPAYCYTIFNFYRDEYSTYFSLRWL
jgi:hypothetical protein